jgi:hypothetical protein
MTRLGPGPHRCPPFISKATTGSVAAVVAAIITCQYRSPPWRPLAGELPAAPRGLYNPVYVSQVNSYAARYLSLSTVDIRKPGACPGVTT